MFVFRLIVISSLCFSQLALANYDPEKIKNAITSNPSVFLVSGWDKKDNNWIAQTSQKWMSISINDQQSELISPFLNAKQMAESKARCFELAISGLSIGAEADKNTINRLIDTSSQHHQLKSLELNGAKFEVTPKLVGPFVRLFCTVKASI